MPKKKLTAEQQSKVDKLAKARDLYGKKTREGLQVQNRINKLMGVNKVHDYSNAPTAKQMRVAGKMKKTVLATAKAEEKIRPVKKAVAKVMKGSNKTTRNVKTALAGVKRKKRNYMAGE